MCPFRVRPPSTMPSRRWRCLLPARRVCPASRASLALPVSADSRVSVRGERHSLFPAEARLHLSDKRPRLWLQISLGAKFSLRLRPLRKVSINLAQFEMNLCGGLFGRTQAEVKTFIVGASVAASGGRKPSLAVHGNTRAVSITIAASSAEWNGEPMIAAVIVVQKQHGRSARMLMNDIHPSIVVDLSEGRA